MRLTVAAIAERIGGEVRGDPTLEISGAAPAGDGKPGEISFAVGPSAVASALASQGSCLIVEPGTDTGAVTAILALDPKWAFVQALKLLYPEPPAPAGIDPTAHVAEGAALGKDVYVGPGASVGPGARIGDRTSIAAGAVVGPDARIGSDSVIHPRVVIYPGAELGERVVVHAGVVLGADGFGYVSRDGRHEKFPQLGGLVIGDDVEIGANTTIDRGALGPTVIGSGTKIDNLVQIGHNVRVGEHCFICAQVGIAGSSVIGDHVVMAGQVGIGDHARVESGAILAGRAGVLPNKIVRAGQVVWGLPARPIQRAKLEQAQLARLPRLAKTVAALARKLGLERD